LISRVSNTNFKEDRTCTDNRPAFYGLECAAKENLVKELKHACQEFGFFQLVNHSVSSDLQESILHQSKEFFDLPIKVKEKYSKGKWPKVRIQRSVTVMADGG
jgi:isopenicillin N synthase-like dioxygenase